MSTDPAGLRNLLVTAHTLMGPDNRVAGPKKLALMLSLAAQAVDGDAQSPLVAEVRTAMLSDDPNNPVRGYFARMLRTWDFAGTADWADGTATNSTERRQTIYRRLELTPAEESLAQSLIPFADLTNTNIVIAESHKPWYTGARRAPGFYWKAYRNYLRKSDWHDDSIEDLNEASDLIIERLSDPLRHACFVTKGLVVGYVQSGKTANFTAVVAKAADAGYRLIIVFAGTLDILRTQTQRRLDKELIGKELIQAGVAEGAVHDYAADHDWVNFIEHTVVPSKLEAFDIERLTGLLDDFKSLGRGIGALEFRGPFEDRPYNHPDNLNRSPLRIVVMKKNPARISALRKDLQRLRNTPLGDIPTLIIDDESDQASVNTTKPPKAGMERARTATNLEIVKLIGRLPRAQYVGYTATPFANVFIDPRDAEDLFPKDFLIGLKRPSGYMGVRDFFDFDRVGRPLGGDDRPPGYQSNERAFLRDIRKKEQEKGKNTRQKVKSAVEQDDKDLITLPEAIDSFVLSGALKLLRESKGTSIKLRHHTMLVHRSTTRTEHYRDRDLVLRVWDDASYGSASAERRLEKLWDADFEPVCENRAGDLPVPANFSQIVPFIGKALERIRLSTVNHSPVRIVNAELGLIEQIPDFDRENVWSILVGGAKLSRGFTVEGLTISYFRRRVKTADTLMQTGRWFGFRQGYHDLVRVFFGRDEPDGKKRTFDLKEAFKAICMDEEMFRAQLRRYMKGEGDTPPITPKQVPPLVPQHLLRPSAKNKMYNATIRFKNFGGLWSESTRVPDSGTKLAKNADRFRQALKTSGLRAGKFGARDPDKGKVQRWDGYFAEMTPTAMIRFLDQLDWADGANGYVMEREFLRGTGDWDPQIRRWIVLIPQQSDDVSFWPCGTSKLKVVQRARTTDAKGTARFNVFSEPRHRVVAEVVAQIVNPAESTPDTLSLRAKGTAVMILYPTVEMMPKNPKKLEDKEVAMGFTLLFPENKIREPLVFGVRDQSKPDDVVVTRALP